MVFSKSQIGRYSMNFTKFTHIKTRQFKQWCSRIPPISKYLTL